MTTVSANQRTINIINKALEAGFEFDNYDTIEDIQTRAEDFLIENTTATEEECEVESIGSHGQHVSWSDGKGWEFSQTGQIVDFNEHWYDAPETKVFHNTVVDSEGQVINLYYLVGETSYNAPEGYYYSQKEKKHLKIEE